MFVTIEGPIGVGKSTATSLLSRALGCEALYEIVEENPFLKDFYIDPDAWALQCETFFLLNRLKQLEDTDRLLKAGATVVSDYNIIKNRLFAELTLTGAKQEKYVQLYQILTADLPRADLVIYLRADHSVVMERIRRRDRSFERNMDPGYIRRLMEGYDRYLADGERAAHIGGADFLVVETTDLDLAASPDDRHRFAEMVSEAIERRRSSQSR